MCTSSTAAESGESAASTVAGDTASVCASMLSETRGAARVHHCAGGGIEGVRRHDDVSACDPDPTKDDLERRRAARDRDAERGVRSRCHRSLELRRQRTERQGSGREHFVDERARFALGLAQGRQDAWRGPPVIEPRSCLSAQHPSAYALRPSSSSSPTGSRPRASSPVGSWGSLRRLVAPSSLHPRQIDAHDRPGPHTCQQSLGHRCWRSLRRSRRPRRPIRRGPSRDRAPLEQAAGCEGHQAGGGRRGRADPHRGTLAVLLRSHRDRGSTASSGRRSNEALASTWCRSRIVGTTEDPRTCRPATKNVAFTLCASSTFATVMAMAVLSVSIVSATSSRAGHRGGWALRTTARLRSGPYDDAGGQRDRCRGTCERDVGGGAARRMPPGVGCNNPVVNGRGPPPPTTSERSRPMRRGREKGCGRDLPTWPIESASPRRTLRLQHPATPTGDANAVALRL